MLTPLRATQFESEDKPPYRISISNDSDLKGGGAIEDVAKVRRISWHLACFGREQSETDV